VLWSVDISERTFMQRDYQRLELEYLRAPDQDASTPGHHPVIIAGAGPVGLAAAIDLAQQGVRVLLVDDDNKLSTGSRAICFAKRTLEIFDRLGCGDRMAAKGVSWQLGKVFFRDELVYSFNLLPEEGHRRPAFINLQQYYAEGFLLERAQELENIQIRWRNAVAGVEPREDHVALTIQTPDGLYRVTCDYLVAADGAKSPIRGMMGLETKGQAFRDRFLIADVKMCTAFPAERWFWFDPPFHRNKSVLLHRQPDDVWRIDFQLGWDADPAEETKSERVIPRVKALLGEEVQFDIEWCSVYTFACARMEKFRHGRVLFAGDAAHRVSPFGARGANSGIQDAENLAWKLKLVLEGNARNKLLDSYASEREFAADENILNSTRSTDFITPKSEASRVFRDAVLTLSKDFAFARKLVNSGRLSVPAILTASELNTSDMDAFEGGMIPGAPAADAPIMAGDRPGWFLNSVGNRFAAVYFAGNDDTSLDDISMLKSSAIPVRRVVVMPDNAGDAKGVSTIVDVEGLLAKRFDARPGTLYLLRPDQHVCGRWRQPDPARLGAALARASCTS
jgi:3-(3-hydroxy-phenyl)propionate hydroxylase